MYACLCMCTCMCAGKTIAVCVRDQHWLVAVDQLDVTVCAKIKAVEAKVCMKYAFRSIRPIQWIAVAQLPILLNIHLYRKMCSCMNNLMAHVGSLIYKLVNLLRTLVVCMYTPLLCTTRSMGVKSKEWRTCATYTGKHEKTCEKTWAIIYSELWRFV